MAKAKKPPTPPDNPPTLPAKVADQMIVERTTMPISKMVPAPYNPREIDEDSMKSLKAGIARWGIVQEIVVNKRTGHIIGGHQRVKALAELGQTDVPVCVVDLDETDEKALNIQLNNPRATGRFTSDVFSILDELAIELPELSCDLLLDELRIELNDALDTGATGKGDFGDDPGPTEPPVVPVSQPGEIYALGMHTQCPKCGKLNHLKADS